MHRDTRIIEIEGEAMTRSRRITRRGFLRGAAAAVAVPYFVPRSAFGANDRPTVGIIGLGGPAGGGAGGTQKIAVCDVREDKLTRYVGSKETAVYRDFRELLARDDIDAVMIGTPDHWHAIAAIEAAKRGKDIYCEKPMSLTIREARAMVNAVRRYGVIFQTGSQQRSEFGGRFRFAAEMVRSGRIGQIQKIHVNVGGPSGPSHDVPSDGEPVGVDWDMWLGQAPWRPFSARILRGWRPYRDYSGGSMTDMGAHHFDIAQWALDMDHSGPVEILPPDGRDVQRLTYVYANGVRVYHGGGEGGSVVFHGTEGRIMVSRGDLRTEPPSVMKDPIGPHEVKLGSGSSHKGNWVECMRTRRRPVADVEVGCRSVTVCHLGNIAYQLRRPLKWDPLREDFVGDAEASRLLDRPRRPPWRI